MTIMGTKIGEAFFLTVLWISYLTGKICWYSYVYLLISRDGNGSDSDRVQKNLPATASRKVYLNALMIVPTSAFPHPHLNLSGFKWVSCHPWVFTQCIMLNNNSLASN
jgi:hypothetical protein